MKYLFGSKRNLYIYMLLHTAVVITISLVLLREYTLYGNPFFIGTLCALLLAVTVYTAHRIIVNTGRLIQHHKHEAILLYSRLQTETDKLNKYAVELNRRADILNNCQKELSLKANLLGSYSSQMDDLITSIDDLNCASDGDSPSTQASCEQETQKAG